MTNENENAFPKDDEMYNEIEKKLNEVKLNGEALITIVREFARMSRSANHEQIHVLADLVQAILASLAFAHHVIAVREGGDHHGN